MKARGRCSGFIAVLIAGNLLGRGLLVQDLRAQTETAAGKVDDHRPKVAISTSAGDFIVELQADKSPISVLNFVDYAEAGFYEGTLFHRVKPGGLIQGGAYTSGMELKTQGLRPPIRCESGNGLQNEKGTVAFYREVGKVDSATAQFFVNLDDNTNMDRLRDGAGYAVFGRVSEGTEVVERIAESPTGTHPQYAAGYAAVVPRQPIIIKSVKLLAPWDRTKTRARAQEVEARLDRDRAFASMTDEERLALIAGELEEKHAGKFVQTESGVRNLDLRIGNGLQPTIENSVEVQYQVTLLDGSLVEDTYAGKPRKREVHRLVRGLQESIQTMKEGGQRLVIVPPDLAYGEGGQPGTIPPNAWLVFNVELLAVE